MVEVLLKSIEEFDNFTTSHIKWTSVPVQEIVNKDYRLEASVYGIEGRQARKQLEKCKWDIVPLCGENGLASAYHRPRFKRIYVDKSNFPIYQPAQINEIYPKPSAYISDLTNTDIDALKVKKGQVLLTCSGTIGNCSYVHDTLHDKIFSHDLIRINPNEYGGYIYAYLKSNFGNSIINTNNYGAVVSHIEPLHLEETPIPNPPPLLKLEIHNLIEESFKLRDLSNNLIDESQDLLKDALNLPDFETLNNQSIQFDTSADCTNFSVPLSDLNHRLDASFHLPIIKNILNHINKNSKEVTTLSDKRLTESILLPGRFKRVYVEEGSGIPFFGGKQLLELIPKTKKYLSLGQHDGRIESELKLKLNQILITRSGTIGKVAIVPSHWEKWVASEDVIRINPVDENMAGYIFSFLSSEFGQTVIKALSFGAVQDHIDPKQLERVAIPLLDDISVQTEINNKVLLANDKRSKAHHLEQKALQLLSDKIIYRE